MTLQEPSPQGFSILRQNSSKLNMSACKSEITKLCTFMLIYYEFSLGKELVYPIFPHGIHLITQTCFILGDINNFAHWLNF